MRPTLSRKVLDYLQDAHAMEQNVLLTLDSALSTTRDPGLAELLDAHVVETRRHERLLRERLMELGEDVSLRREAQSLSMGLVKGLVDQLRTDKAGKNLRDAWLTEQMEIASYELLERLASRAGDSITAQLARNICGEEMRMSRRLSEFWDAAIEELAREAVEPAGSAGNGETAGSRQATFSSV